MKVYKIHEAKIYLLKMAAEAWTRVLFFISNRNNIKIHRIQVRSVQKKRKGGQWKDKIIIAEDFDLLPDEISKIFGC